MNGQTAIKRGEHMRLGSQETTPEQRLATAVLHLAAVDLRLDRGNARLWFESSPGLDFWCEVLNLDPDIVRAKALAGQVDTPRQRIRAGKYRDRRKPEPELETSNP